MLVVFSHGKEGSPNGTKSKIIEEVSKQLGYDYVAPDYTNTRNPDDRVDILMELVKSNNSPIILAGSSMGGYVSTVVSSLIPCTGLFLIAPALYMPNYSVQSYQCNAEAVYLRHGWNDDIIPVEHSIRFAREMKCDLKLVNDNHRMSASLLDLRNDFTNFLKGIANKE